MAFPKKLSVCICTPTYLGQWTMDNEVQYLNKKITMYFCNRSGMSFEESKELTEDTFKQVNSSSVCEQSQTCTEAQKPNQTVEVTHKELRSREVKSSILISHQESSPKNSVKASPLAVSESVALSNTKTTILKQDKCTAAPSIVEELAVLRRTSEKVEENKPNTSTPTQEAVLTSSQEKETLETSMKVIGFTDSAVPTEQLKRKVFVEPELSEKKPCIALTEVATITTTTASHRFPPLKVSFVLMLLYSIVTKKKENNKKSQGLMPGLCTVGPVCVEFKFSSNVFVDLPQ